LTARRATSDLPFRLAPARRGRGTRPQRHRTSSAPRRHAPALDGVLDGIAVRVPVEDGSLTDLALQLRRPVTAEEINAAFTEAAEGPLRGILRVTTAPVVSRDIVGDPASCVVDAGLTQAHGDLVKVFGWYDNEWGYSNRLLDLTEYVAARL
jgi:glyceraldehyde 3-phosphate dehydrogenase